MLIYNFLNKIFILDLNQLSHIAKHLHDIDIKGSAAAFKTIIKLASTYKQKLIAHKNNNVWLENCVKLLIELMDYQYDRLKYDCSEEIKSQIERTLKINGFYLQILEKLVTIFENEYFHGHYSLMCHIHNYLISEKDFLKNNLRHVWMKFYNIILIPIWKIILTICRSTRCFEVSFLL